MEESSLFLFLVFCANQFHILNINPHIVQAELCIPNQIEKFAFLSPRLSGFYLCVGVILQFINF